MMDFLKRAKLEAMMVLIVAAAIGVFWPAQANAQARFSGGACISQGTWLQAALNQADIISNALNTLKNDPNCQALIQAVENSPKFRTEVQDPETTSFADTYQELQAISDYLKPSRMGNGMNDTSFRNIVFNVVFNKSYDALKNIHTQADLSKLTQEQREDIRNVSLRLKSFLNKTQAVADMTISTTRNLLAALPQSELCMDNRPSETAALFGAIAHSVAALATGGRIDGVGSLVGSLMRYTRDMKYIQSLKLIEMSHYQNSVSCLVESTSEAYCSIQDAEDSLDFLKTVDLSLEEKRKIEHALKNPEGDPVVNPLGGLIILMRDVPVMQSWMQKVLFGIDPRLKIEADMKNAYWQSYLNFIQQGNSLLGSFRDREQIYLETTSNKDYNTKLSQVKVIFDQVLGNIASLSGRSDHWNFFTNTMQSEMINFYLLGYQSFPPDFLEIQKRVSGFNNQFESWWFKMAMAGSGVFSDPDEMIRIMRSRLNSLLEKAQIEANTFFAKRMIVDPQNLLSEAMKGPGVTPFQAFTNLRNYYNNLASKLDASSKILLKSPDAATRVRGEQLRAQIPMLRDSVVRINKIIAALQSVAAFKTSDDLSTKTQSEEVMGIIYEWAYMLVARDSFFGTRMQTALHADLSDTLWRREGLTERQLDFFLTIAPEIVSRLAGFYSNNPVVQRSDVSAAKMVHLSNLKAIEQSFAKVLYKRIMQLDCDLFGGKFCLYKDADIDPVKSVGLWDKIWSGGEDVTKVNKDLAGEVQKMTARLNNAAKQNQVKEECVIPTGKPSDHKKRKQGMKPCRWKGLPSEARKRHDEAIRQTYQPTEDSRAHMHLRAKLCVQALAFESREFFKEICDGAVLNSEFADNKDPYRLNMSFNEQLEEIKKTQANLSEGRRIDTSRGIGVCSLRTYIRKNHIFYMYREYMRAE